MNLYPTTAASDTAWEATKNLLDSSPITPASIHPSRHFAGFLTLSRFGVDASISESSSIQSASLVVRHKASKTGTPASIDVLVRSGGTTIASTTIRDFALNYQTTTLVIPATRAQLLDAVLEVELIARAGNCVMNPTLYIAECRLDLSAASGATLGGTTASGGTGTEAATAEWVDDHVALTGVSA